MDEGRALRVLVIEDARLMRLYYRGVLEKDGFRVEEALNGLEGLEKALTQAPDLMVVDINMPKMDGLTFLAKLREGEGPEASTPVLMTSTEAKDSDKDAARAAGANFYLVKPIAPDALLAHVRLLSGRRI